MEVITRHAAARAVSRLGFEPTEARRKLKWLHGVSTETRPRHLPAWFRPARKTYSDHAMFWATNYAGLETVLVVVPTPEDRVLVTVITERNREPGAPSLATEY